MIPANQETERMLAEFEKIDRCIKKIAPLVLATLQSVFKEHGMAYELTGKGSDLKYTLKKGPIECSMFLRNLFLEIATIDRDTTPLYYDTRCDNPEFLAKRMYDIVGSKLAPLLPLMSGTDPSQIEKIAWQSHPNYERFRVTLLKDIPMSKAMLRKIEQGFMPDMD